MKKLITLLVVLVSTLPANAQWWGSKKIKGNGDMTTETRSLGNYDRVHVAGSFDVILISGSEGELTVEAESNLMEYLITETDGDALKIKVEKGVNIQPSKRNSIIITVPFTDIEEVNLAGSGDVVSKAVIEANNFECAVAGSGDIILEIDAQDVKAAVAGSGDLTLKGTTQNLKASVAGSGDIHTKGLESRKIDASVAGSGDIELNCDSCDLKARVSGSGDIKYLGKTNREDFKVSGSGSISNW